MLDEILDHAIRTCIRTVSVQGFPRLLEVCRALSDQVGRPPRSYTSIWSISCRSGGALNTALTPVQTGLSRIRGSLTRNSVLRFLPRGRQLSRTQVSSQSRVRISPPQRYILSFGRFDKLAFVSATGYTERLRTYSEPFTSLAPALYAVGSALSSRGLIHRYRRLVILVVPRTQPVRFLPSLVASSLISASTKY